MIPGGPSVASPQLGSLPVQMADLDSIWSCPLHELSKHDMSLSTSASTTASWPGSSCGAASWPGAGFSPAGTLFLDDAVSPARQNAPTQRAKKECDPYSHVEKGRER